MKRILLILTLALALVAAACGDDTDTAVGDDTEPPADDIPADDDTPIDDDVTDPPADDVPLGGGPYPIADLTIEIDPSETEEENIRFRLACLGDTATITPDTGDGHPADAAAMCLALNDLPVRDRVLNGAPADQACTEQYGGPEQAWITGTLDGEQVDTAFDRADGCGIGDWALMSAFLPAPPA